MVNKEIFRKLALSFPEVVELPHFEKTSFRVKRKIFATLSMDDGKACLKLSAIDQSVFSSFDNTIVYPVNNKWGRQGWTWFELHKIKKAMLKDALACAYREVAPQSSSKMLRKKSEG